MVFERKVMSKGNEYWVLIHPIRKGKKIIQKSRYIGKILPPRERLEQLKKEFLIELTESRFKYLSEDESCMLEAEPLQNLAKDNEFMAYKHTGFWQCMDTIRDADYLNELWKTNPEWKIWD